MVVVDMSCEPSWQILTKKKEPKDNKEWDWRTIAILYCHALLSWLSSTKDRRCCNLVHPHVHLHPVWEPGPHQKSRLPIPRLNSSHGFINSSDFIGINHEGSWCFYIAVAEWKHNRQIIKVYAWIGKQCRKYGSLLAAIIGFKWYFEPAPPPVGLVQAGWTCWSPFVHPWLCLQP